MTRRNVRCVLCRRLRPEHESRRGTINGQPGAWACARCYRAMKEIVVDPSWPAWTVTARVTGQTTIRAMSGEAACNQLSAALRLAFAPESVIAEMVATDATGAGRETRRAAMAKARTRTRRGTA